MNIVVWNDGKAMEATELIILLGLYVFESVNVPFLTLIWDGHHFFSFNLIMIYNTATN
jgi:hypothetical protein